MKIFFLIVVTAIITAATTFYLYTPISVAIFKLKEPVFERPIKNSSGVLDIRSDTFGEGDFGAKRSGGRTHLGVDISADLGVPVYAAKSGIAFRGNIATGYGKYVFIYHPDGTQTLYGHLSKWAVSTGKKVRRGDLVGFVGKTGNAASKSIKAHLHFEIRKDGEAIDPIAAMR